MVNISEIVKQQRETLIKTRRFLHKHPELSGQETNTLAFIKSKLEQFKIPIVYEGEKLGLVARLNGPATGRVIAFRADIDALPLHDEKDVDYASSVTGVMHACGHDGHTAILLGLAEVLSTHPELIQGDILFVFQQHEEMPPGGAKGIVESGILADVDAIYGLHLWTFTPCGQVGISVQQCMSANELFKIELTGRGGHGAAPHKSVDTLLLGAHIIQALQYVVSRNVDPIQPAVLTVGKFNSGRNFNIIAEQATLEGSIRYFDDATRDLMRAHIEKTVAGACASFGAEYSYTYENVCPAVINDPTEAERVHSAVQDIDGVKAIAMPPQMISEDFSYYLREIKGCYFFVGAANEEAGIVFPHHHPRFDLDENALEIGLEVFLRLCIS